VRFYLRIFESIPEKFRHSNTVCPKSSIENVFVKFESQVYWDILYSGYFFPVMSAFLNVLLPKNHNYLRKKII